MLTKSALKRARAQDRAYGGTGNCHHQFGGPEPPRAPVYPERTEPPKSGDHVRQWDEGKGIYVYTLIP